MRLLQHSKVAGEDLSKHRELSVNWSLPSKLSPITVLLALGFRILVHLVRFPGYNHRITGLGRAYTRCGSGYTQGVCSANDLVPRKSVIICVFGYMQCGYIPD